jgi:hypothetical protein
MPARDRGVDVLLWDFGDTVADERWCGLRLRRAQLVNDRGGTRRDRRVTLSPLTTCSGPSQAHRATMSVEPPRTVRYDS